MARPITILLVMAAATAGLLSPPCAGDSVLYSGDQPGSTLSSEESLTLGNYSLKMRADCNLVLSDGNQTIWSTNTVKNGSPDCHLAMQSDGNLVIYSEKTGTVWASDSQREEGFYVLVLQRDRNVVVYGNPSWASNTKA